MSNYYVRRSGEDDYLEHSGGWKWSKPTKYIDKIMKNGRWVYVYARSKANSVASNVRRSFNRATGLSDRRAANIASNRWRESLKGGNRAYTHTLRARANKFQNRYNKSLLGRAESALSRVSSAGANARNAMAKAASQARSAGASFTGSIKRGAYQVGNAANKARRKLAAQSIRISLDPAPREQWTLRARILRSISSAKEKRSRTSELILLLSGEGLLRNATISLFAESSIESLISRMISMMLDRMHTRRSVMRLHLRDQAARRIIASMGAT